MFCISIHRIKIISQLSSFYAHFVLLLHNKDATNSFLLANHTSLSGALTKLIVKRVVTAIMDSLAKTTNVYQVKTSIYPLLARGFISTPQVVRQKKTAHLASPVMSSPTPASSFPPAWTTLTAWKAPATPRYSRTRPAPIARRGGAILDVSCRRAVLLATSATPQATSVQQLLAKSSSTRSISGQEMDVQAAFRKVSPFTCWERRMASTLMVLLATRGLLTMLEALIMGETTVAGLPLTEHSMVSQIMRRRT